MPEIEFTFKPLIVIVDDVAPSVAHLKEELSRCGAEVHVFTEPSTVVDFVQKSIVDLFLLDVNLDPETSQNRGGVLLAEELCGSEFNLRPPITPEAAVIFISRPSALDVEDVLRMFNLKPTKGVATRYRLAEGFAEKTDTRQVVDMTSHVLAENIAWSEKQHSRIVAQSAAADRLNGQLKSKFADYTQAMEQFSRLIRELCLSPHLCNEKLEICDVSKGRSRSIVVNTRRSTGDRLIESRILKIGSLQTIQKEILNYKTNVPRILRGGSYPLLVGSASSRQMAGICYSDLGVGAGIPDSFGDRFWELDYKSRQDLLDVVFHELICDSGGAKVTRTRPLLWLYRERFNSLATGHNLHKSIPGFVKNSRLLHQIDHQTIRLRGVGENYHELVHPLDAVQNKMANWYTTGHLESVVHGDLHPDNILIHDDNLQTSDDFTSHGNRHLQPFLIDFTHTDQSHAALDYVVMDAMLRSQSLRSLLFPLPPPIQSLASGHWVRADYQLVFNSMEAALMECTVPGHPELSQRLGELIKLSSWLRTTSHRRLFTEGDGFYHAAFGYVCYSFLSLGSSTTGYDSIRDVLLAASASSFTKALHGGVGTAWISPDLTEIQLAEHLATSSLLWKTYLLRVTRGDIHRINESLDGAETNAAAILNQLKSSPWGVLLEALRKVKSGWPKEIQTQLTTQPAVFDCVLLRRFLDLIKDLGVSRSDLSHLRQQIPEFVMRYGSVFAD